MGPLPITDDEFYKFPAACDEAVLPCGTPADPTRFVELWAQIYRPKALDNPPYSVIVLLHGNHSTCGRPANEQDKKRLGVPLSTDFHVDDSSQYTTTGTCPAGYTVVNNHLGYGYFAKRLASWGYIVVSINANRGITAGLGVKGDPGLIFSRGRLILRHLALLKMWNDGDSSQTPPNSEGAGLPATLAGKLNLGQVVLIGHSRGGEGVRAALALYRNGDPWPPAPDWRSLIPGLEIAGIFEIGPTDASVYHHTGPPFAPAGPLNASGVKWNVLLPMCDGDVSNFAGIRPFDRMLMQPQNSLENASPAQKSSFTVWGANHNFYNTEWQVNDSFQGEARCIGKDNHQLFPVAPGSEAQQATAISSVLAFVRATFESPTNPKGNNPAFDRNFNPIFSLPRTIEGSDLRTIPYPTRVDRGHSPSPSIQVSRTIDDFDRATGSSSYGVPNDMHGIEIKNLKGEPYEDVAKCPDPLVPPSFIPEADPSLRGASLSWSRAGEGVFLQVNWTAQGAEGMNLNSLPSIGAAKALEFRVSRRVVIPPPKPFPPSEGDCIQPRAHEIDPLNKDHATTDFAVAIAGANGVFTKSLPISKYLSQAPLSGPVGAFVGKNLYTGVGTVLHATLQTVSIPLRDFEGLGAVERQTRGVRFIFDQTTTGAIYLANVRFTNTVGPSNPSLSEESVAEAEPSTQQIPETAQAPAQSQTLVSDQIVHTATVTSIHELSSATELLGEPGVEIDFKSDTMFPVRDEQPTLHIGAQRFELGGHRNGDLHTIFFVLNMSEFAALPNGAPVVISYGNRGGESWDAGALDKSMVQKP